MASRNGGFVSRPSGEIRPVWQSGRRVAGRFVHWSVAEKVVLSVERLEGRDQPSTAGLNTWLAPVAATAVGVAGTAIRHELVLVEANVAAADSLLSDLFAASDRGTVRTVVRLTGGGLDEVTDVLRSEANLDGVSLISHGSAGALDLGSGRLDAATLAGRRRDVAGWAAAFRPGTDILLYGCDFAASPAGRAAVDELHALTGAGVAASTDPTGAAALGGNWTLEYRAGTVETPAGPGDPTREVWRGLLGVYTVSNANDSGAGSLRQAILAANAAGGPDTVEFNIPPAQSHTITLQSTLPRVTGTVRIDATTDPAFARNGNRPAVTIDGDGLSGDGLTLTATADNSVVKGLVVRHFRGNAITLQAGADGNTIAGNYLGGLTTAGDSAGAAAANTGQGVWVAGANNTIGGGVAGTGNVISGNDCGVLIDGSSAAGNRVMGNTIGLDAAGAAAVANRRTGVLVQNAAHDTTVGTDLDSIADTAEGNLVSGNGDNGVQFWGSGVTSNAVRGNVIGLNRVRSSAVPNATQGIQIGNGSSGNTVGGTSPAAANVIAGNALAGIELNGGGARNNTIQGNLIGTSDAGAALGNGSGVYVVGGPAGNIVGGVAAGQGNTIAFNRAAGVAVVSGTSIQICGNSVFGNGGLGIDLGNDGVTANDAGDSDAGPNGLLNTPALSGATLSGSELTVTGDWSDAPFATGTLDLYWSAAGDPSGYGEGKVYLGSVAVAADMSGTAGFSRTFAGVAVPVGATVSATATDPSGNTSEFSRNRVAAVSYSPPTLTGSNDLAVIFEDPVADPGTPVAALFAGRGGLGIAVTAVDDRHGTWQYTTDGGATWANFGSVDVSRARLLVADPDTAVRFAPNADWVGTVPVGLTFHAWDRSSGTAGGTADLTAAPGVLDRFDTVSYGNNDGTKDWTTTWSENDSSGNNVGADDGSIKVKNRQLTIQANSNGDFIERAVDSRDAAEATLSMSYTNGLSQGDLVAVQVSTDDGTTYVTLDRFTSVSHPSSGRLSLDVSPFIGAGMRVRFLVTGSGSQATLRLDDIALRLGAAGEGYSTASVSAGVSVLAVNDRPTRTAGTARDLSVVAGSGATPLGLGSLAYGPGGGADETSQTLTYRVTTVPPPSLGAVVLADGVTAVAAGMTYTLADLRGMRFRPVTEGAGDSATFAWVVRDDGGTARGGVDTLAESLRVTVTPAPRPPTASADSYTTGADTILVGPAPGVLANDTPGEAGPLAAEITRGPTHGTLTLHPDGSFSYSPVAGYAGSDRFTYRATDGRGGSSLGEVTLSVTAPVGGRSDTDVVTPVGTPVRVTAVAPPADTAAPQPAPVTAELLTGGAHGTVTMADDGSFSYTPDPGYTGPDTFRYRVIDGQSPPAVKTVTIQVQAAPAVLPPTPAVLPSPVGRPSSPAPTARPMVVANDLRVTTSAPPTFGGAAGAVVQSRSATDHIPTSLTAVSPTPPATQTQPVTVRVEAVPTAVGQNPPPVPAEPAAVPPQVRPPAADAPVAPVVDGAAAPPPPPSVTPQAAPAPPPPQAAPAAEAATAEAARAFTPEWSAPIFQQLEQVAGDLTDDSHEAAAVTTLAFGGAAAAAGYVLLNTRAVLWFLSALLARPAVWRRFDPLDVIYAWELEGAGRPDHMADPGGDDSLQSIVG